MSDLIHNNNKGQDKNGMNKFEYIPTYSLAGEESKTEKAFDPKRIIALLLRYKWLVALFVITGGVTAWFYAGTLTPIYQSNGTMIISAGGSGDDELSRIISQTTGFGRSSTLANELQVLQSRGFSNEIAQRLMNQDEIDISDFPILWNVDEDGVETRASEGAVTSRVRQNLTSIRPERDSEVIRISFQSSSPLEAAHITNLAMEVYVDRSTSQNRRAAESTAEFLENEKDDLRRKLDISEQRLKNYMDNTGIVRVDEQASGMVTQQMNVEMELHQLNIQLQSIEEAISNHELQIDRIKPGLTEQFSEAVGPRIRNSQEQLARYEGERTLILTRNPGVREREQTPPRLKYLDEEIERVKDEIRELSNKLFTEDDEYMGMDSQERAQMVAAIQAQLTDLRIEKNMNVSRINALEERKRELDRNFDALPQGMIELARLQRDVMINEELFLAVSRQYAEMSVLKQSQYGFGRIIDTGLVSGTPVSPNKILILIFGIMLGSIAASCMIIFKEFTDNSINSLDQLKLLNMPLLTAVPVIDKVPKRKRKKFSNGEGTVPDGLVLYRERSSIASESVRRLKTNLTYQYGDNPPKTIDVTSAEKGDGKSMIVSNLGIAFAEDGYKTVIIDTDFRRPNLHNYFGMDRKNGLIDYLNGSIALRELVRDTDYSKLKIITSGSNTHQPESIANSKDFRKFLEKMEEVFDVVIFDTPPFGIISDSAALLKIADANIMVSKYRKTNRAVFLKTLEELERINANVNGIVLNGFDYKKEAGSIYGSGYYKAMYSSYESYSNA